MGNRDEVREPKRGSFHHSRKPTKFSVFLNVLPSEALRKKIDLI